MRTLHSICFGLFSNEWNTQKTKATVPAAWPLRCAPQRPCRSAPARLHSAPTRPPVASRVQKMGTKGTIHTAPLALTLRAVPSGGPAGARRSTPNCARGVFTHPASPGRHLPVSDRELLTCVSRARGPALSRVYPEERGRCSLDTAPLLSQVGAGSGARGASGHPSAHLSSLPESGSVCLGRQAPYVNTGWHFVLEALEAPLFKHDNNVLNCLCLFR